MVLRDKLVTRLKTRGFNYHGDTYKSQFYRKGITRVAIPKRATVSKSLTQAILRQAGEDDASIKEFFDSLS